MINYHNMQSCLIFVTNQWTTKPILMMNWDLSPIAVVECLLFMSNRPSIIIIKLNI